MGKTIGDDLAEDRAERSRGWSTIIGRAQGGKKISAKISPPGEGEVLRGCEDRD